MRIQREFYQCHVLIPILTSRLFESNKKKAWISSDFLLELLWPRSEGSRGKKRTQRTQRTRMVDASWGLGEAVHRWYWWHDHLQHNQGLLSGPAQRDLRDHPFLAISGWSVRKERHRWSKWLVQDFRHFVGIPFHVNRTFNAPPVSPHYPREDSSNFSIKTKGNWELLHGDLFLHYTSVPSYSWILTDSNLDKDNSSTRQKIKHRRTCEKPGWNQA